MKQIVNPKCPYCHREIGRQGFNSPLVSLYGEYCSDTATVKCEHCGETYYVSKQTRFISRKKK